MSKRSAAFLFLLFLIIPSLRAQNLTFFGVLPNISQTGKISHKFDYQTVAALTVSTFDRTIEGQHYPARAIVGYLQGGLIYKLSRRVNLSCNYRYQRSNPFSEDYNDEHRIFQHFIFQQPVRSSRLIHRFRFEERFVRDRVTLKRPLSTRFRYQLAFNVPLEGNTLDKGEFYFNSYNEFFFSLTGRRNAFYSEDWAYAGIGYHLGRMGRIETGYLFQMQVRNQQKDRRYLHLIQCMWITNFSFKKEKSS